MYCIEWERDESEELFRYISLVIIQEREQNKYYSRGVDSIIMIVDIAIKTKPFADWSFVHHEMKQILWLF